MPAASFSTYAADFEQVSTVLAQRGLARNVTAFSLGEDIVSLETAMHECGPMAWALILHADALTRLCGLATSSISILPVTCVVNSDAPFGNQAIIQAGFMPMSMTMNFLDAALEHAICLGMQHYGYSPSTWEELPMEQRIIPIEPYFHDLKENWITDAIESGDPAAQVSTWPALIDDELLEAMMNSERASLGSGSRVLQFPSIR
ncbi:hypothetical protein SSTU70S_05487 [Stutzerimonas stutzeri]